LSELRSLLEELLKRRRGFLWLLAAVLANGVLFAGVTHRLANKQDRLAAEHARLSLELTTVKQELRLLEESAAVAGRNAEAVRGFWRDVVQEWEPGLTEAWDEIDKLASESNVARGRTAYARELLDSGLEQVKATMPVEGDYFDLVRFINRLERSERFFLVEKIALSQSETGDRAIQLDCSIAFFLKGGAPSPGAGP